MLATDGVLRLQVDATRGAVDQSQMETARVLISPKGFPREQGVEDSAVIDVTLASEEDPS